MGIHSTKELTREQAEELVRRFVKQRLKEVDDDRLADILFGMFGDQTYSNFTIVEESQDEDNFLNFDYYVQS